MSEKQNKKDIINLFINRELTDKELKERYKEVGNYMVKKGGIIIAISCHDGILLVGSSPDYEPIIFPVFNRIGLLGIGRTKDCQDIHRLSLRSALTTELDFSKNDVDIEEITDGITQEIDKALNYTKSPRGLYKANFIIADLGLEIKDDYIDIILFYGGNRLGQESILWGDVSCKNGWSIIETSIVKEKRISFSEKTNKSDNQKKNKIKQQTVNKNKGDHPKKAKGIIKRYYRTFVYNYLKNLIDPIYSNGKAWSIKEAAFFIGVSLLFLDERCGGLEMVYLDRDMFRRGNFYNIWQKITNPNPYSPSTPWEDWKKFTASIRKKIKNGEIYSEFKELVELLDMVFKKGLKEVDLDEEKKETIELVDNPDKNRSIYLFNKIFKKR